jgi:hypothetical protein
MIEIWRAVPGYEGLYRVSSEGRVKRCDKYPGRVLKFGYSVQGRRQVVLCRDGVKTRRQVHALVCEAFNGPCPPGLECRHGDGDHLNNRPGNLEWNTHAVNMRDKALHGTQPRGESQGTSKLTEDQVRAIRASGGKHREVGRLYGVSGVCIHLIRAGKTWQHVV